MFMSYTFTAIFTVPSPAVSISYATSQVDAYAGNNVTLRCTITVMEGVTYGVAGSNSDVVVSSMWKKDGVILSNVGDRVIVGSTRRFSDTVYFNEIMFHPLSSSIDGANYTCDATLTPVQLTFITGMNASKSFLFNVQGEVAKLSVW